MNYLVIAGFFVLLATTRFSYLWCEKTSRGFATFVASLIITIFYGLASFFFPFKNEVSEFEPLHIWSGENKTVIIRDTEHNDTVTWVMDKHSLYNGTVYEVKTWNAWGLPLRSILTPTE